MNEPTDRDLELERQIKLVLWAIDGGALPFVASDADEGVALGALERFEDSGLPMFRAKNEGKAKRYMLYLTGLQLVERHSPERWK